MKCVIMQPTYLPWMGYFDLIYQSDIFVFLDDVQFTKQSWQQRNKIKTSNGEKWLTVPVIQNINQKINETKIDGKSNWKAKHIKSIKFNYSKSPYFDKYFKFFEEAYSLDWKYLADLNIHIIKWIAKQLDINKDFLRSSTINVKGKKTDFLVNMCKKLNADTYLSPLGSSVYIEKTLFEKEGIKLEYQNFEHPTYRQLYGKFIPYLSVIDLLFNEGSNSPAIIRSGRRDPIDHLSFQKEKLET
jgi:hypothetical protein